MRAYILVEAGVGKTQEVARQLRGLPSVTGVYTVTGPYDVIATITGENVDGILDLVVKQIHKVEGVVLTVTCVVVGEYPKTLSAIQ